MKKDRGLSLIMKKNLLCNLERELDRIMGGFPVLSWKSLFCAKLLCFHKKIGASLGCLPFPLGSNHS